VKQPVSEVKNRKMTDDKNSLDDLVQAVGKGKKSARKGKQKSSQVSPSEKTEKKALNPLDLLTLPATQRKVVNYLSHQKRASLENIQKGLPSFSTVELEQAMRSLRDAGYIREALLDGEVYYRVVFGGTSSRSKIFLPPHIWSSLNVDKLTFLKQIPMFQNVPRLELRALANQMEERYYQRNEVIVWQGESSDNAFLIKNGIVGISHLSPDRTSGQTLAYLKQGDILGEIGILESQTRSATATALSNVETLVLKRDQFLNLLQKYDTAAIELARMLGRQLLATSARLEQSESHTRLVLVFKLSAGAGGTTIASALAATLARETEYPTVYSEYPDPHQLPARFGFAADLDRYHHPAGYDIQLPQLDPELPDVVDATLMIDQLLNRYTNIIIGLPDDIDEGTIYMLRQASQIILVAPPDAAAWENLQNLRASLKKHLPSDTTGILTVINRPHKDYKDLPAPGQADFDLPFMGKMSAKQTPKPLQAVAKTIVERLGRTCEIAVYIPTTIDVDQRIDTTAYVDQTLAFLGERFGGATSNQARGVWDSEEAGLVNEVVYIVRSFVTHEEMNLHLDSVLDYAAELKKALKQEAIALEVDRKLMLV
jgi:CRP-like cAMP-binding protein